MPDELPPMLRIGADPPEQGQKAANPGVPTTEFLDLLHFLHLHKRHAQRMPRIY
jgi:hypothetical protein